MGWLVQFVQSLRARAAATRSSRRRAVKPVARRFRPSLLELEALEDRCVPSGTSVIQSNFNGTAVAAGDSVWFSSVVKVSGLGSTQATLHLASSEIDFTAGGKSYNLTVPNATITFSPTATTATTSFDVSSNTWLTTVPESLGGNIFLSGLTLPLTDRLPGGINPVTWQGTFQSDTPGLSVNWQWAGAAYTQFGSDYNALNVKPVDDNHASAYQNSDHAGTPEAFKSFVTGGVRGGGGSNWTGSYSATANVTPDVVQAPPVPPPVPATATLSGSVTFVSGAPVMGVTFTLTNTSTGAQFVVQSDSSGNFNFTAIPAGTYNLVETVSGKSSMAVSATAGTDNGQTDGTAVSATEIDTITLNGGDSAVNYNFVYGIVG
jgi:hypothetical protein